MIRSMMTEEHGNYSDQKVTFRTMEMCSEEKEYSLWKS